jgi:hypothetical protein
MFSAHSKSFMILDASYTAKFLFPDLQLEVGTSIDTKNQYSVAMGNCTALLSLGSTLSYPQHPNVTAKPVVLATRRVILQLQAHTQLNQP